MLIRCQAGMNRSSLVTDLVLMKDGLSADEAIALIRQKGVSTALVTSTLLSTYRI